MIIQTDPLPTGREALAGNLGPSAGPTMGPMWYQKAHDHRDAHLQDQARQARPIPGDLPHPLHARPLHGPRTDLFLPDNGPVPAPVPHAALKTLRSLLTRTSRTSSIGM